MHKTTLVKTCSEQKDFFKCSTKIKNTIGHFTLSGFMHISPDLTSILCITDQQAGKQLSVRRYKVLNNVNVTGNINPVMQ